ncbi:MAG: thioredoxin domain-containing protein [Burkholderiales bacterium]|nr:thioredoxin domain-containing protein [Burkholderiales bacterium]
MANRLAGATSPYLQQHANNPVDWYPWGEEALARARGEDKPILLSVGYSACHWCHVMAHESFEDPVVAALMNDLFVNVKVDREERPDLDQIYQAAHALLTRRNGGWPLTMFLTPAGEPFYGGTYFPKEARYGLPGFSELLPKVAAAYREQGDRLAAQHQRLAQAMRSLEPTRAKAPPVEPAAAAALAELKRSYDPRHGGFGSAPKFPHPFDLDFCLRTYARDGDAQALAIVRTTLERMADGGIHDQVGGGFCRYSVDATWTIPHFEKMLYDNALLLGLYADLARVTGDARHREVARDIVGWLDREMRAPDGAFWSSLDADSEGHEGRFYVWTRDEARAAMSPQEWVVAEPYFGFDAPPNFEGRWWNPRVAASLVAVAQQRGLDGPDAATRLAGARAALFAARERRVRPGRDEKILTAWNALAIAALARASTALDLPRWGEMAMGAADALRRTAWHEGRLLATRRGEGAALNAYLDDHAFLLAALVELMQLRFRTEDYAWARALADVLLEHFEDRDEGGFFFTSHDHERLFHRTKPGHDNATPSGNGVAARALAILGHLTGELRYVEAARRTVTLFADAMAATPQGYATLFAAAASLGSPPAIVLLHGDPALCAEWRRVLVRTYRPAVLVLDLAGAAALPAALVKGAMPASGAAAYVCRAATCLPAIDSLPGIEAALC